jgi:hypothetical protein
MRVVHITKRTQGFDGERKGRNMEPMNETLYM